MARVSGIAFGCNDQALIFAAFTAFWTVLAFRLQAPPFGLGADVAGLFGIVGAVGIFAAPLAGNFADKHGPSLAVAAGAVITLLAWIVFGLWDITDGPARRRRPVDFAMQAALVANQHIVFALRPEARGRLNTVLMGCMFLGGSFGSAAVTVAWEAGRWPAVTGLGIILGLAATAAQINNIIRNRRG